MKVGILGTGHMGTVHASKYALMAGVSLVAFDRDPAKLEGFCATHGAAAAGSMDDLLTAVDAVDICLPTQLHHEAVRASLAARVPTMVEKPMGRTLEECALMVDLAKSTGTLLTVGHVCRFFAEHRLAHDLAVGGRLGDIGAVRMRRGGRAPTGSDGWFQDTALSGGVLLDLAVHEFDWLLWTLGRVERVYAQTVRHTANKAEGLVGDYALTTLKFVSGAVAHVEATWMDPSGFRTTLEVAGSGGLVEYDSRSEAVLRTHTSGGSVSQSPMAQADDPYFLQAQAFLSSVSSQSRPAVSPEEAYNAVAVSLAAVESAKEGRATVPAFIEPLS